MGQPMQKLQNSSRGQARQRSKICGILQEQGSAREGIRELVGGVEPQRGARVRADAARAVGPNIAKADISAK